MDVDPAGGQRRAPLGPIIMELPADTRIARVARLAASALGALVDFTVDDIDDVRIGIDELVVSLIELGRGEPIRLTFDVGEQDVCVVGETLVSGNGAERQRFSLSERILAVVADEYQVTQADGVLRFRLLKRATPS